MAVHRATNVIAGSGVGVTVADNTTTGQQDVTITATAAGPSAQNNGSFTGNITDNSIQDLGSVTIVPPAAGFILFSITFGVEQSGNTAGCQVTFDFGYGTTGSAFVDHDAGVSYQTPSDLNLDDWTYTNRIAASTSTTIHALWQRTGGTALPQTLIEAKARIQAVWVPS